jgi:hypothetical protein
MGGNVETRTSAPCRTGCAGLQDAEAVAEDLLHRLGRVVI